MNGRRVSWFPRALAILVVLVTTANVVAATWYVDGKNGNDGNPGSRETPLRTIGEAAERVRKRSEGGPTTIKLAPGVYPLAKSVEFATDRPYTESDRLVIEALVLPDDAQWQPAAMPVILSTEDPRGPGGSAELTETYGFHIRTSCVTLRGLKFLGNPLSRNWHCPVSRIGENLRDLLVTQCAFLGDPDSLDIYSAVLASGDGFVVDHCIFSRCHAGPVFWGGEAGIAGKGNAMRYCIVEGDLISGVWTSPAADDFEFHHNIVTRSEYFWMRNPGNPVRYRLRDCIAAQNKYYSGYGLASGPTGETGSEITYEENNVRKTGEVLLERDRNARRYLHVLPGTLGSELGAGLFRQ